MTFAVLLLLGTAVFGHRLVTPLRAALLRLSSSPRRPSPGDENILLAELTALGLSAGMSFSASLAAAADHVSVETGRRVRRALRSKDTRDPQGPGAALFALADRATVTGAPLLASIDGYALSLRRNLRAQSVERARRLPVKLLFPLALLILPGFLLLTIGPAVLAGVDRLGL